MKTTALITAAALCAAVAMPARADDAVGKIVGTIAKQVIVQEQDRAAFAAAQKANTASAYRSYLQQFPNGAYASYARERITAMGGTVSSQPLVADSGLTRAQRTEIQKSLNRLGYSTGGTDGDFGPSTRRAIGLWQRDRNYAQTGRLTQVQANEILNGRAPAAASTAGTSTAGAAAQAEAALRLNVAQRSAVQAGLTRRGFDTRGVDGAFGPATRNALAGWQKANDFAVTGYLTAAQFQRLTTR